MPKSIKILMQPWSCISLKSTGESVLLTPLPVSRHPLVLSVLMKSVLEYNYGKPQLVMGRKCNDDNNYIRTLTDGIWSQLFLIVKILHSTIVPIQHSYGLNDSSNIFHLGKREHKTKQNSWMLLGVQHWKSILNKSERIQDTRNIEYQFHFRKV